MIPPEKARKIRGLVCGVDGVLTNGTIGYGSNGQEIHFFDARDGLAIRLASWYGIKIAWITGRLSSQLMQRANELEVPLYTRFINKEVGLRKISLDLDLPLPEIAYIGDDLNDLLAFHIVGFPIAVANAPREVREQAAYITQAPGGQGAVRETIEAILHGQGCWEDAIANYLATLREPQRLTRLPRTEE